VNAAWIPAYIRYLGYFTQFVLLNISEPYSRWPTMAPSTTRRRVEDE
jgi:hypothetical protein